MKPKHYLQASAAIIGKYRFSSEQIKHSFELGDHETTELHDLHFHTYPKDN
jgi:hypothetical protein